MVNYGMVLLFVCFFIMNQSTRHVCTDSQVRTSLPLSCCLPFNTECPEGKYGQDCTRTCNCGPGSDRCDAITGCVCLGGWFGVNCERDVNECDDVRVQLQCQLTNAVCYNYAGSYRCQCESGYSKDSNGTCLGNYSLMCKQLQVSV